MMYWTPFKLPFIALIFGCVLLVQYAPWWGVAVQYASWWGVALAVNAVAGYYLGTQSIEEETKPENAKGKVI